MKKLVKSSRLIPPSKLVFFLFLFFLPQQFGPHSWPAFSYVHGVRVDYLSPALYVSDVLIIILFLLSFRQVYSSRLTRKLISSKLFILFLFILLTPLFFTKSPPALLYGMLKLFEFVYLGLFISTQIKKADIPQMIGVIALTGFFESILAISQFFKQGSVGGLLYFFGERTYHLSTIGIAVMNTAGGLIVRPYGTFPHPNVLAFFLFTSIVFSVYRAKKERNGEIKSLLILSFAACQIALLLTFSRVVIILNILFLLYVFLFLPLKEKIATKKKLTGVLVISIFFILYFLLYNLRFFDFQNLIKDVIPRQDLTAVSLSIVKNFPIFGIGLNNFFYYQVEFQKHFSTVYLQPVHNIFLLLIAQIGIVGFLIFGYFITVTIVNLVHSVKKAREVFSFQKAVLFLLISILIAGFFDHYFLTIQQGQLMLALILGLSWNRSSV